MTRVNLVSAEDLADQHLFAEWREIKMIVPAAKRSLRAKSVSRIVESISPAYTLNTGHVTFFYDKLNFLRHRFNELTLELVKREFNIAKFDFETDDYKLVHTIIPQVLWVPTKKDIECNIIRISERLGQRPDWYRYYGEIKPPEFFIDRYNHDLTISILADV